MPSDGGAGLALGNCFGGFASPTSLTPVGCGVLIPDVRGWYCYSDAGRSAVISTVVVPLAAVVLTLAGGWLVSTRVSDRWDQIKRRRESDVAAAEEFQRLYGEFFAVWKSWNAIP